MKKTKLKTEQGGAHSVFAFCSGEKHKKESKERFYDEINCAYTWIGYYLYNEEDYNESLKYFKKVIKNYSHIILFFCLNKTLFNT